MWVGRHFLEISHDNSCTQTWIISCISNALRISGIVVTVVVDVVHHRKIKFSHRSNSGHTHTSGLESMRLVNRYISRLVIGIFYSHGMQNHCVICQVELGNMKARGVLTLVQIKIALKWPRATEKKRGKKYHQIYYDKIHEPSHIWFSLSLLVCVCVQWMFCILFHGKFGIKIKPITIMAPLSSMCLCVYMGYIVHIRFTCHNVYFSWQT